VCKNYGMENSYPEQAAKVVKTQINDVPSFTTKDGSAIRELLHPTSSAVVRQSLAEAIVEPGQTTAQHCHHQSEELYHITQGKGLMWLGAETFTVAAGDSIVIAPGTAHAIQNTGNVPLKILCMSAPAYSHDDTELL
jgi:mannose-6-phosphate isomerase-like protein (cupin superfamily)